MDIKQIENLLEKAEIIKNKYDDLAEYTGENFNVFNILRLDEKELMHSAFIANLLNVKGDHKQKDIFFKLFIDEIKGSFLENEENRKKLEKFDTLNSSAQEEEYIGKVDYESGEGGRIDIVVKDGNNVILIENKIGAGDQEAQLCRYYNYYTDSSIIYLTPYGSEPSESSKGHLENNKDFICISYEQHIVNWIENCIKEMAKKPIIRETLNQYLHLVKQITNQTTNNKMEQELTDLILSNEKNYNAYNASYIQLINATAFKITQGIFLPHGAKRFPGLAKNFILFLGLYRPKKDGHLTLEQRYKIETYLSLRRNKIEIAAYIGKDKSVISREIKRNADARNGVYKAALADKKAKFRHQTKAKKNSF